MNICIVGGGATGLTAGYELIKKGHKVTIFERDAGVGGLVGTFKVGDLHIEKLYHHIFTSDLQIIELIEELGLGQELMWREPKNAIYINDKLYPFTSPVDLLLFKELSPIERIAMGMLVFRAKFVKDWKSLETMSVKEWIVANAGMNVYEKVWRPLLNSKFDIDSDKVSAVWIWNKFKLRGSTRGKNINKELLGYMHGSFGIVYEALASRIKESGGTIVNSCKVNSINPRENKTLDVVTEKGTENFDRVIVTAAPSVMKNLGLSLPSWYIEKLDKIKYKSNICVLLELKESLSPYYWITVAQNDSPLVLVIEHTKLIPDPAYKSNVVYLSRYLDESSELYSASDDHIIEVFLSYLKKLFPAWDRSSVINAHVNRARFAQPVVMQEYSKIIPDYKTPIENLYLASMAQIYPEDRGQNYSVRMGREISGIVDKS